MKSEQIAGSNRLDIKTLGYWGTPGFLGVRCATGKIGRLRFVAILLIDRANVLMKDGYFP